MVHGRRLKNYTNDHEGCLQKKNCPEGDIGTYKREGGKKIPFFYYIKKGGYSMIHSRGLNLVE